MKKDTVVDAYSHRCLHYGVCYLVRGNICLLDSGEDCDHVFISPLTQAGCSLDVERTEEKTKRMCTESDGDKRMKKDTIADAYGKQQLAKQIERCEEKLEVLKSRYITFYGYHNLKSNLDGSISEIEVHQ